MIEDDWPFLHLNLISPSQPSSINNNNTNNLHQQPLSLQINDNQDLSPIGFDPRHLEAWTNINFSFDEIPPSSRFNNPISNTNQLNDTGGFQTNLDLDDPFSLISPSVSSANHSTDLNNNHNNGFNLIFENNSTNNPSRIPSKDRYQKVIPTNHSKSTTLINSSDLSSTHPPQKNRNSSTSPSSSSSKSKQHPQVEDHRSPNQIKNSEVSPSVDDDDGNRIALEDDKRRRNTLASARFRMKKKMKEQEIERTAKEMKERVSELEKEVENLKQENKWLRGLIVDQATSKLITPNNPNPEQDIEDLTKKRKFNQLDDVVEFGRSINIPFNPNQPISKKS